MLPKKKRLTSHEVRHIIAKGKRLFSTYVSAKIVVVEPFSAAIVVPKRVAKTAVKRNSIRRALYNALRNSPLPVHGRMVVFVDKVPKGPLAPAFAEDVRQLLRSLK
jgi:ribonuclease P protein component